jgi:hypothetical protein
LLGHSSDVAMISTIGAPMTCLQEGKYKRWHND